MNPRTLRATLFGVALTPVLFSLTPGAVAAPVQWSADSGGNDHYYEVIHRPYGITWDEAQAEALSRGGYLATLTSSAENTFVFDLSNSETFWSDGEFAGPWFGGFQPEGSLEPGGGFQWVNGDGTFAATYSNWRSDEPNNFDNSEDRVHFTDDGNGGRSALWNDVNSYYYLPSYVVEFDTKPASEDIVIASGDAVAGTNGDTVYRSFGIPSVGNGQFLAFRAMLRGPSGTGDAILTGATPTIYRKKGDAADGIADATFLSFADPLVNYNNEVAFLGNIKGVGVVATNNTGLWSNAGGVLRLIAREGEVPVEAGGDSIKAFVSVALSGGNAAPAEHNVAFVATLTGPAVTAANDRALFFGDGTELRMTLRDGGTINVGGTFKTIKSFDALRTRPGAPGQGNGAVQGAVFARVTFDDNTQAIVYLNAFNTFGIARTGDPLAGGSPSPETTFRTFGFPALSGLTASTFIAKFAGGPVRAADNAGIFAENANDNFSLELRVRKGDDAFAGSGSLLTAFKSPVHNDEGTLGFIGTMKGSGITAANNTGIWLQERGNLVRPIALEAAEPTGVPGAQWQAFVSLALTSGYFDSPAAFAEENLAAVVGPGALQPATPIFTARMRPNIGGVESGKNFGAWWVDTSGASHLITRQDDFLDVNGATRQVRRLHFLGVVAKSQSQRRGFNDDRQITYRAAFMDGTSAIFRQALPPDEPRIEVSSE